MNIKIAPDKNDITTSRHANILKLEESILLADSSPGVRRVKKAAESIIPVEKLSSRHSVFLLIFFINNTGKTPSTVVIDAIRVPIKE